MVIIFIFAYSGVKRVRIEVQLTIKCDLWLIDKQMCVTADFGASSEPEPDFRPHLNSELLYK